METELRKCKDKRDARMAEMEQQLRMYHQINHVFVGQQDSLVGYQVSVLSWISAVRVSLGFVQAELTSLKESLAALRAAEAANEALLATYAKDSALTVTQKGLQVWCAHWCGLRCD